MMKMKAITVNPKKSGSVKVDEVPLPKHKANEVLVKVLRVGIDGTDKDIIQAKYGQTPKDEPKLIIGHEALGVVERVPQKVRSLKKGDYVVPMVRRPDNCINCKNDEQDMCLTGKYTERGISGAHGFLCEYFVEKEEYLIKIPKNIIDVAVLLEPFSVAEKAIRMAFFSKKRFLWKPRTALITGSGTLGLICALLLKLKGLEIIVADRNIDKQKTNIFKKAKIKHVNTQKINLHDIPKKYSTTIDLFIDATGNSGVALHGVMITGQNSTSVLLSVTGGTSSIELCSDCFNNGLVLGNKTIIGCVNANKKDFKQGVKDMVNINKCWPHLLKGLLSEEFSITEIDKALTAMNTNIKVVINPGV